MIRSKPVLGGLHHEYSLERVAASASEEHFGETRCDMLRTVTGSLRRGWSAQIIRPALGSQFLQGVLVM